MLQSKKGNYKCSTATTQIISKQEKRVALTKHRLSYSSKRQL